MNVSELPKMQTWSLVMILSNAGTMGLCYASKMPKAALLGPSINLIGLGLTGVFAASGDKPKEAARAGLMTSALALAPGVVSWRQARHPVLLNGVALTAMSAAFFAAKFGNDAKE